MSTATPTAVAPQAAPPVPAWTTPQILKTGLGAICFASVLLMGAALMGARSHRHAIQTIGKDSAPSIIAAQHIRAALADMDADAANELLVGGSPGNSIEDAFDKRRTEAITAVVTAAENITYGDAERAPIHALALGVGTYAAYVQMARDKHAAGDPSFLTAWRTAARFMDENLLPAAANLDQANRKQLDRAYDEQHSASIQAAVLLILGGAVAGIVLIAMQIFLAGRMRRTLNPMLFLATLGTLIFLIYSGQRFAASDRDLKIAKEDAFESIHALWQARALAYSANGDESRYLLDPAQAAKYEGDFQTKAAKVDEFLGNEMKNITFAGEGEAGRETVAQFAAYKELDRQIRTLEKSGRQAAAIALCTGSGPKQSNGVFQLFDSALGRTLAVNQKEFDVAVGRGFEDLSGFEAIAPLAAVSISVLAWLGLRARIREYLV